MSDALSPLSRENLLDLGNRFADRARREAARSSAAAEDMDEWKASLAISELVNRRDNDENEKRLLKARAEGAESLLLEVQQECIALRRACNSALDHFTGGLVTSGEAAEDIKRALEFRAKRSPGLYAIENDGFVGRAIGFYQRLDGYRGLVLQQIGTKVVHVYGEKFLKRVEGGK